MSSQTPKPFHCSDCGKEFSKEKTLISHFKVHATDKSYKCNVCKEIFYTKTLYKNHLRTHTEKGNYPCPKCGKVFVRNSWLKKHLSLQCDEDKQKDNKFLCKDCGKSYDSLTGVKTHLIRGKHFEIDFRCHGCPWTCTSSKTLFVHILQHNNIDVIIVGYSEEKRLEYYSTAKVRSKLSKYQPKLQEKASEFSELTKDLCELSKTAKITSDKEMSQLSALPENNKDSENKLLEQEKIPVIIQEENEQHQDAMLRDGWVKARVSSNRKNTFEKKFRENLKNQSDTSENKAHEAMVSVEKHALPALCEIPKKLPKLLRLYPDEEMSPNESTFTDTDRSFSMPNDSGLDQGAMYAGNHIPRQMNTLVSNPIVMPYSTPLVNSMYLPPLFIMPTTAPVTQGFSQQHLISIQNDSDKMLSHTDTYDSQLKNSKSTEQNITDKCKEVDNEEILIQSKTHQLETKRHNVKDPTKALILDDFEGKYIIQSSSENIKRRDMCKRKFLDERERKFKAKDDVLLDHKVNVILDHFKTQLIEKQEDQDEYVTMEREIKTTNDQMKNKDVSPSKNDSHLWDTLMESDLNTKYVSHYKNSSLSDILRTNAQTPESIDGREMASNTSEEIPQRKLNGKGSARNKQPGSMGGIDVEDYIKKFMWF